MSAAPPIITARILRDLANGLQQQMFFWGQDILHPEGNVLLKHDFDRSPSTASGALKGSSCYSRDWLGGRLELYGSCAGWYGPDGGFTFIRPMKRCILWKSSEDTPIPGVWQPEHIATSPAREDLYLASHPLLDWIISYEEAVLQSYGESYRQETYKRYQKVPKAKKWIEPASAVKWFQCLRETPEQLDTPKKFAAA